MVSSSAGSGADSAGREDRPNCSLIPEPWDPSPFRRSHCRIAVQCCGLDLILGDLRKSRTIPTTAPLCLPLRSQLTISVPFQYRQRPKTSGPFWTRNQTSSVTPVAAAVGKGNGAMDIQLAVLSC